MGVLLALYAFGIGKAALMPFHAWLPAAMVAPTPVSALLHAVAVVKAGVFCVTKVVVYVFGLELLSGESSTSWLVWIAGASILIASIIALQQDNLKRSWARILDLDEAALLCKISTDHSPEEVDPVCGVNDVQYRNACEAECAGRARSP